jgi:hypothetical protein
MSCEFGWSSVRRLRESCGLISMGLSLASRAADESAIVTLRGGRCHLDEKPQSWSSSISAAARMRVVMTTSSTSDTSPSMVRKGTMGM